ncbi:hypothetical protein KC660_02560, partial [Candidatus Dojkabacteria bacterium]|nr:hypothetical protein [Candidatus Dojkabacteria bacterium]
MVKKKKSSFSRLLHSSIAIVFLLLTGVTSVFAAGKGGAKFDLWKGTWVIETPAEVSGYRITVESAKFTLATPSGEVLFVGKTKGKRSGFFLNARYATQPVELSTQAEMLLGNASGFAAELNSEDPNRFSAVLTGKTDGALTIPFEARYDGQRYADLVTKITQLGKSKKVLSGKKLRLKVTFTNTGDVIVPRKGSKLSVDFLNIGYSAVLSVNRMSNIENCEVVESPQS